MLNSWDERRDLYVAESEEAAVAFAAEHWVHTALRAVQQRGKFAVALSGGSTPKAIYKCIAEKYRADVPWDKVWLFWSDERAVAPEEKESNYKMAMECGFGELPIPKAQIHRMKAEKNLELESVDYERLIRKELGVHGFDLVMLGVGEDGHTASLFPGNAVLDEETKLVAPVFLPETKPHRMTLTFPCINQSHLATIYALGAAKAPIVPMALNAAIRSPFPASRVGTPEHKALWVLDKASARLLNKKLNS